MLAPYSVAVCINISAALVVTERKSYGFGVRIALSRPALGKFFPAARRKSLLNFSALYVISVIGVRYPVCFQGGNRHMRTEGGGEQVVSEKRGGSFLWLGRKGFHVHG